MRREIQRENINYNNGDVSSSMFKRGVRPFGGLLLMPTTAPACPQKHTWKQGWLSWSQRWSDRGSADASLDAPPAG